MTAEVVETAATTRVVRPVERDPLIAALARYVEALHARYPDGPNHFQLEGLDARAKVSRMKTRDPAA